MSVSIDLGEITAEVEQKDVQNIHLSVYPPNGRVRISAPLRMELETIRVFAVSKLGWIKREQKKLLEQDRESPREYIDRENIFFWGDRYLLKNVSSEEQAGIEIVSKEFRLLMPDDSSTEDRRLAVEAWYRHHLRSASEELIMRWEPIIGVKVSKLFIQRMKTKWGSCNPDKGNIRLNLELVKKPRLCLEYIVVHEMVHLLERTHNDRFRGYLDQFLPNWKQYRDELNRAPLAHVDWTY